MTSVLKFNNKFLIRMLANSANYRYKHFTIPKRTGGTRKISQPSFKLKFGQRLAIAKLFHQMPVSKYAKAYESGSNIVKNAEQHRTSNFFLRLDFKEFFHSFDSSSVRLFLSKQNLEKTNFPISNTDLTQLFCYRNCLAMGAPSSPGLTNRMMYQFDEILGNYCNFRNIFYTRYADDLFFSSKVPFDRYKLIEKVKAIQENIDWLNLSINERKTSYRSRKHRVFITGITITSDHNLSVGRNRKRHLKTKVYLGLQKELSRTSLITLLGELNFVFSVEPNFHSALKKKFGEEYLISLKNGL